VDEVVARLVRRADREHGASAAPKHPEPDAVTLLLREARRRPDAALEAIAREALDAIARHLVDPAAGAFFRYGAADDWTGPHTEKVTLDQAALIRLFLEAERALGDPAYGAVARRALAHARAHLMDASGRVYASIAAQPDADVDMRRFADASAALASAFLATRGAGLDAGLDVTAAAGIHRGRAGRRRAAPSRRSRRGGAVAASCAIRRWPSAPRSTPIEPPATARGSTGPRLPPTGRSPTDGTPPPARSSTRSRSRPRESAGRGRAPSPRSRAMARWRRRCWRWRSTRRRATRWRSGPRPGGTTPGRPSPPSPPRPCALPRAPPWRWPRNGCAA
jgi:hypothetical protein